MVRLRRDFLDAQIRPMTKAEREARLTEKVTEAMGELSAVAFTWMGAEKVIPADRLTFVDQDQGIIHTRDAHGTERFGHCENIKMIYRQQPQRPDADELRKARQAMVHCTRCNWRGIRRIDQAVECPDCGHTAHVGPEPQRPEPDSLSGSGHLRRCTSCDWQGRKSQTLDIITHKHRCPRCSAGTKRVWRGEKAIKAELGSLGTLDLTAKRGARNVCDCPLSDDQPCEFHPDNLFCQEHGWCEDCAAMAADPESERLKAQLSVDLPPVADPTDELIESIDSQLNIWPGLTDAERAARSALFAPELRWHSPLPLPPAGGELHAVTWVASEYLPYPPWLHGLIQLPESAEENYRRLTEERKRRQVDKAERPSPRDVAAEAECLSFGHVNAVGRCIRCKLTEKDQELLRANYLDSQPQGW